MATIKITKDGEANTILDVRCRTCKRSTKHKILSDIHLKGRDNTYEDFYGWDDKFQIVQCQGCETLAFRKTHMNSDNFRHTGSGDFEEVEDIDIYPNPETVRNPVEDDYILPSKLGRIYHETLAAINSGQPVLAGIGIRAIVETVCKDKNTKGTTTDDLSKRINDLVNQGLLTNDGATILHKLRTLGNEAAHEVKPHDNSQLNLAMNVIDHLLQGVYILPCHAKSKFS